MSAGCTVVLDVGKTVAKLSLWDASGTLLDNRTRPNARVVDFGVYLALDVRGITDWLAATLLDWASQHSVATIIPVGHGAAAAVIRDGRLTCQPIDYENPIPVATRARYDTERDAFLVTGSPALPNGLNLGAQLAWLEEIMPAALAGTAQILPWPQYWAWVLSGVAASEVTSLGTHTDLWNPHTRGPSALAQARGWAQKLAPVRLAHDVLGAIRPEWVARTGLSARTQVLCGIHDSNCALNAMRGFAELQSDDATVVSTGTWFVAMRLCDVQAGSMALPEHRDCLFNVDRHGRLVPSARFMGGREIEILTGSAGRAIDSPADEGRMLAALADIVHDDTMILPTQVPGVGPYPKGRGGWHNEPTDPDARLAAISVYAALTVDTALDLIGACRRIVIEGRFARAALFVRTLASLRRDCPVFVSQAEDGVAFGALRLVQPELRPRSSLQRAAPLGVDLSAYKTAWRTRALCDA
jgi:sugar (pentulose or hexulose) kinase